MDAQQQNRDFNIPPPQAPMPRRQKPKIAIILALAGVIIAAAVAAYFFFFAKKRASSQPDRIVKSEPAGVSYYSEERFAEYSDGHDGTYTKKIVEEVKNSETGGIASKIVYSADHIAVGVTGGTERQLVRDAATRLGAEIIDEIPELNVYVLKFDSSGADDIKKFAKKLDSENWVESISLDYQQEESGESHVLAPNDRFYKRQTDWAWGMKRIHAEEAWNLQTDCRSVTIAVIDSGFDYGHPDLAGNMLAPPDGFGREYSKQCSAKKLKGGKKANDCDSHGTKVVSAIAAEGNNGIGVAGVCWKAKILPFDYAPKWTTKSAKAVVAAVKNGAKIINYSVGNYTQATWLPIITRNQNLMSRAIAFAGESEVVFVAAAGNENFDNDLVPGKALVPASLPLDNIISVANSTSAEKLSKSCDHRSGKEKEPEDYCGSNWGAKSVDLAAPGTLIGGADVTERITYDGNVVRKPYVLWSGTSASAPVVSGAIALMLSYENNPEMSVSEIKERLLATVDKFDSYRGRVVSGGRLNLYKFLANKRNGAPMSDPITLARIGSDGGDSASYITGAVGDRMVVFGSTNGAFPAFTDKGDRDLFVSFRTADGNVDIGTASLKSPGNEWFGGAESNGSGYFYAYNYQTGPGHNFRVSKKDSKFKTVWTSDFGKGDSKSYAVAEDNAGFVYVAGATDSDFGYGSVGLGYDIFLMKMESSSGNAVWVKYFDWSEHDTPVDIKLGGVNSSSEEPFIYILGTVKGSGTGIVLVKIGPGGEAVATEQIDSMENPSKLAVDKNGYVFFAASRNSAEGGSLITFKYSPDLSQEWTAEKLPNAGGMRGSDVVLDGYGHPVVVAEEGVYDKSSIILVKYDTNTSDELGSKAIDFGAGEIPRDARIGVDGRLFIAGEVVDGANRDMMLVTVLKNEWLDSIAGSGHYEPPVPAKKEHEPESISVGGAGPLASKCTVSGEWVHDDLEDNVYKYKAQRYNFLAVKSNGNRRILSVPFYRDSGFSETYKYLSQTSDGWNSGNLPDEFTSPYSSEVYSFYYDSRDTLHMLFANSNLIHGWLDDGGSWNFTTIAHITDNQVSGGEMVTGSDGVTHIFYSTSNKLQYVAHSSNGGISPPTTIALIMPGTRGIKSSGIIGVAVDGANNPHVALLSDVDSSLKHALKNGGSWNFDTVPITGATDLFFTATPDGTPHFAFIGQNGSGALFHVERKSGGGWIRHIVTKDDDPDAIDIFLADDGGGLHFIFGNTPRMSKYAYLAPGSSSYEVEDFKEYFKEDFFAPGLKFINLNMEYGVIDKSGGIHTIFTQRDSGDDMIFNAYRCP